MQLSPLQQAMLAGEHGPATRKAMEILTTLGDDLRRGAHGAGDLGADRRGELR